MSTVPENPTSPSEWLEYAESEIITSIPMRQNERTGEEGSDEQASIFPYYALCAWT